MQNKHRNVAQPDARQNFLLKKLPAPNNSTLQLCLAVKGM